MQMLVIIHMYSYCVYIRKGIRVQITKVYCKISVIAVFMREK